MKKTVVVMLGIVIIFLIIISILGGINFIEIKEKVNSVKNSLILTQDSLKNTIQNINEARKDIAKAKETIEKANMDLEHLNDNLKKELVDIRSNVKVLEKKRELLDGRIAKLKENIPGDPKVLKEPDYHKLGAEK